MHFREDTGIEGVSRLEASTTIGPDDFVLRSRKQTAMSRYYPHARQSCRRAARGFSGSAHTFVKFLRADLLMLSGRKNSVCFRGTAGTMVALVNESGASATSPHGNDSIPMQKNPRRVLPADCLSLTPSAGIWAVWSLEGARIAVKQCCLWALAVAGGAAFSGSP